MVILGAYTTYREEWTERDFRLYTESAIQHVVNAISTFVDKKMSADQITRDRGHVKDAIEELTGYDEIPGHTWKGAD